MRVTKTIREFIEKEVYKRLEPKYAAEKERAQYEQSVVQEVWDSARAIAQEAYNEYMADIFAKYDFLEDLHKDGMDCVEVRKSWAFGIKDQLNITSVHRWNSRMRDEAQNIINDIIVELELGGDKATLIAMLDKIGGEA